MENRVHVTATVVVPDTPEGILGYIASRMSDTLEARVERSAAILVGTVEATAGRAVDVRGGDLTKLGPWLMQADTSLPAIMLFQTRLRVDSWLKAVDKPSDAIDLTYVTKQRASEAGLPLLELGERGLLYLQRVTLDAALSAYVPPFVYQLMAGETGLRMLDSAEADARRQPNSLEAAAVVSEVAAVRWYLALPPKGTELRRQELLQALSAANVSCVRSAVEQLAVCRDAAAALRFKRMLISATEPLRQLLILGLWIGGERDAALQVFGEELATRRAAVLERWQLLVSTNERGEASSELFGPAPAAALPTLSR